MQPINTLLTNKKVVVVANPASGKHQGESLAQRQDDLERIFRFLHLEADIQWVAPMDLAQRLARIKTSGPGVVFVGGGDGTLNTAANALTDSDITLGVLPFGTFNNFARDLGLPSGLEEAVYALATGEQRCVDVGEVNGRVFINNASIGIYPYAVRKRELYQQYLGLSKLPAMGYALLGAFWHLPITEVRLGLADGWQSIKAPFLFLGNNRYQIDPFAAVLRQSLSGGQLSVYYARQPTRLALLKLAVKILFSRLHDTPELEHFMADAITVDINKKKLKLAVDGEVVVAQPPLQFRSRRRALKILVPQRPLLPATAEGEGR